MRFQGSKSRFRSEKRLCCSDLPTERSAQTSTQIRRRIDWLPALLLLPLLILFIGWYIAPLLSTFVNSFHPFRLNGIRYSEWTLSNYTELLTDGYYRGIILRTFLIAVAVALASVIAVYPVAIFIERQVLTVQTYLILIYLTPWLVNVTVKAFGWTLLLGPGGIINHSLLSLGLIAHPLKLMFNELGIFIGLFHAQFVFVLLPVWAALRGIDSNIIYAASNLGAGPLTILWRVTIPLTLPALTAGLIISMTMSLSAFATPALLGGGRARVLSYLSYHINLVQLNWPLGAAAGVFLLALTFLPILILRALGRSRIT